MKTKENVIDKRQVFLEFFHTCVVWELKVQEVWQLFEGMDRTTPEELFDITDLEDACKKTDITTMRAIVAIANWLSELGHQQKGKAWINRPNDGAIFSGRRPLDMLRSGPFGLEAMYDWAKREVYRNS